MDKKEYENVPQMRCPYCGSTDIAEILYGMPVFTEELQRELDAGKVVLGGCCITGSMMEDGQWISMDPEWHCNHCEKEFGKLEKERASASFDARQERIRVFEDTQDWIRNDPDLSESVALAKQKTEVFFEDDYPAFSRPSVDEKIVVSGYRSYEAAMRLNKEFPGSKIAVMNFANAFHAGGGVTKGASAQEESLCRTSTLYPLIYRNRLRYSFYKHHDRGAGSSSEI